MKGLIFTYLLTYGGALAALFNPFVGLLVYVCFAIVRPEAMWPWAVPPGNYSRTVGLALLAGWALNGFGSWRLGRAWGIVAAFVGLLAWSAVSAAAVAGDKDEAWKFVDNLAKIVLPFLVGVTTIDSVAKLKQLAWVILLSQGYLAYEFNLSYLGGYNRLRLEGYGDMDNNSNAIALVTCLGLALFLGLASAGWWRKLLAFAAAGLMAHAILFSFSRGGTLALMVTGAVALYLVPKRPAYFACLALGALLVYRFSGPEVLDRFATVFADEKSRDASAESRVQLWSACWDSMQKRPWGVGPANWGAVVPEYGFPRGKLAHTLWLQIGAELGFPGLGLLVLFYGLCVARLWRLTSDAQPAPDPWFRHLARAVVAALAGFAVAAQFVSLDRLEVPYYVTLIGAGLLKLWSEAQPAFGADHSPSPCAPLAVRG